VLMNFSAAGQMGIGAYWLLLHVALPATQRCWPTDIVRMLEFNVVG